MRSKQKIVALSVVFLLGLGVGTTASFAKTEEEFHQDMAHALLEMHETLATIAEYHKAGTMPPNRDELHKKAAHAFKHALELWGLEPRMHE